MKAFTELDPAPQSETSRVDFSYAFATPHRLTVGRPDSSDRTLLDLQPGSLKIAWTTDDLTHYPLAAFQTPPTRWRLTVTPQIDGEAIESSGWSRLSGYLPALHNSYESPQGCVVLKVVGAETAMLAQVTVTNTDSRPHRFLLRIDSGAWGENPAWVDPSRWVGDNLVAGWGDRADRLLVLGLGADSYSLEAGGKAPGPKSMLMVWEVPAGETRTGWIVRPYRRYAADLDALREHDWLAEAQAACDEWEELLSRSTTISLPDTGVLNAYRACLADLFIMREPVAEGYVAAVPGTECYRAPNAFEAAIVAVALDEAGLHAEAEEGYRMCWEMQEEDGNWADPRGWGHLMWGGAGFKAWAAWRHYCVTGDRQFLTSLFPHLLASSRFQERERARTRITEGPGRPLTYGLMPRGMGDCGLKDDDDLYGFFLPHNFWAVYADRISLEAAKVLEMEEETQELSTLYETARDDLLQAVERGAIAEDGYRWIPGVPQKTSGSRWGALNALTPCGILPGDHELIRGTLRKIESNLSPGGVPVNTGWLTTGMWVAITLDNVAEAHLALKNGDAAARYLYATLNHATPLVTWCEERGQEPGSSECTGDRQHLWTPVAVVRCLRDCLVLEDGDGLELGLGADREWLASGEPLGICGAPTDFGKVSYRFQYDPSAGRVTGHVTLGTRKAPAWVAVHLRLPQGYELGSITTDQPAETASTPDGFRWLSPTGDLTVSVAVTTP
jgi:hypothetical protein